MARVEVKFDGKHWDEGIEVELEDLDGNVVGYCYFPADSKLLDIIDHPPTLWASDNGFSVDDLHWESPY